VNEQDQSKAEHLESMLRQAFGDDPGYWGCKNEASVFIYANEEYGRIIGLEHHFDVFGRTDFDMPCDTVACAQMFRDQDKEVIETRKTLRILDIHPFADGEWRAYLTTKRPLYEGNHVVGTIFHGQDLTSPSTIELGSLLGRLYSGNQVINGLAQGSYWLGERGYMPVDLTPRESEVLFFLIRGQAARSIASIFKISVRTVEDHICSLRFKFDCATKAALIEKAIYLGHLHYVPKSMLGKQLSLILRDGLL
jgi:DNA-binding CsgD family transcriptional regulator